MAGIFKRKNLKHQAFMPATPEDRIVQFIAQLKEAGELGQYARCMTKGLFIRLNKLTRDFLQLNKHLPDSPRDYYEFVYDTVKGDIVEEDHKAYLTLPSGVKAKVRGILFISFPKSRVVTKVKEYLGQ